jgi:hypothetical protein
VILQLQHSPQLTVFHLQQQPLAEDYVAVEVSPTKDAETSLTIMAKEFIEKYSPEVNLGMQHSPQLTVFHLQQQILKFLSKMLSLFQHHQHITITYERC